MPRNITVIMCMQLRVCARVHMLSIHLSAAFTSIETFGRADRNCRAAKIDMHNDGVYIVVILDVNE